MVLIDDDLWRGAGPLPRLGDLSAGRDNNLNLIRTLAATGVLVSHAWPIALGRGTPEPLGHLTGFSLGGLCVILFFAVSGFLIAGSWERRPDPWRFVLARGLRLVPGLAASLVLVALVMGPLVAGRSLPDYAADPAVQSFLVRNLTLLSPQYTLPGVFETNPYPAVEGSIWTLVHEALCYAGVLVGGVLGLTAPRRLPALLGAFAALWFGLAAADVLPDRAGALHELSFAFAVGMAAWSLRHVLPLSGAAAFGGIGIALLVSRADPEGGTAARAAWSLALVYAALWAAYVPAGPVRAFNRIGDYSYGIYVYAFPVQGLAVWLFGPQTPWANVALSLAMTVPLAILSWHMVERPALSLMNLRRRGIAGRPT